MPQSLRYFVIVMPKVSAYVLPPTEARLFSPKFAGGGRSARHHAACSNQHQHRKQRGQERDALHGVVVLVSDASGKSVPLKKAKGGLCAVKSSLRFV